MGGASLGNSWRIAVDVNGWDTVWSNAAMNSELARFAFPGAWNDPDALIGSTPGASALLTKAQTRTQFSLWSVMAAPLLIGSRILEMDAFDLQTYTNTEVIAVDQDPLGIQGTILWENCPPRNLLDLHEISREGEITIIPECQQVWAKRLTGGAHAVILVNWSQQSAWISVGADIFERIGFAAGAYIRDLWGKKDLGVHHSLVVEVGQNGASLLYRFTQANFVV